MVERVVLGRASLEVVCFKYKCEGGDLCVSIEAVLGDYLRE